MKNRLRRKRQRRKDEKLTHALTQDFISLIHADGKVDLGEKLHPADAFFAYRILIGRNPTTNDELEKTILNETQTLRSFLSSLLDSQVFQNNTSFLPPNRFLMADLPDYRFWFNTSDREMGVRMGFGIYEPETVALMKTFVKHGMNCLDIGAQTGFFTCLMASLVGEKGRVFAFEPMPASYALLVKNLKENKFGDRVAHYNLACSDSTKTINATKVSNMFVAAELEGQERITMKAVKADDVVSEAIDVIKIDVEGHEPSAIEGMKNILAKNKPIILSEMNEYWLRTCSQIDSNGYIKLLNDIGYDVFGIDNLEKPIIAGSLTLNILDNVNIVGMPIK